MNISPGQLLNPRPKVRFDELIEPPLREAKEKRVAVGVQKRMQAKMFLQSVASRQRAVINERTHAQKVTWEPPKRPSEAMHIYEDKARVVEAEKLWKELHTLNRELGQLREAKAATAAELQQLQAKLNAVQQASTCDLEEIETLRESLMQQKTRLNKEWGELQNLGDKDVSTEITGLQKCVFCLEYAGRVVPNIQQHIAELRLRHQELLNELSEAKARLDTRLNTVQHHQELLSGAPNVKRQLAKLHSVQQQISSLQAKLQTRQDLASTAMDVAKTDSEVAAALEKVREADAVPSEVRSRSVTVFRSKDAWESAPSAVRSKLSELHKEKIAIQQELEGVEKDLRTPIEEDAYLYAEVRKAMLEKKRYENKRLKEQDRLDTEYDRTIGKIRGENEDVRTEIQLLRLKILQSQAPPSEQSDSNPLEATI